MKILCITSNSSASDIIYCSKKYSMKISNDFKDINDSFDLVLVHGFNKIIPQLYFNLPRLGIFIIHSSDLPKGRGWAPIYHSIQKGESEYIISLIKIDVNVDAGNILLKIRIKKPKYISNNNLRKIDEEASIKLVDKFLDLLNKNKLSLIGEKQNENEHTYHNKKNENENKLNLDNTMQEQILDILATDEPYQSYIEIDGERIKIIAIPENTYELNDLSYNFEIFIDKGELL